MKKLLIPIISLLLLASCNQDNLYELEQVTKKVHFSGVKYPEKIETKGVARGNNFWPSASPITIKFLNDPYNLTETVKGYAKEWLDYAGIEFKYTNGKADIRIAFDWDEDNRFVTWSYTGTDAKYVRKQSEPTANFVDFKDLSAEEQKGEVLRVFGQILGLELEHRHLSFDPQWQNEMRVQSYWEMNISDIEWDEIKEYVFDPFDDPDLIIQTEEFDPLSIMKWIFPKTVTKNKEINSNLTSLNNELSETDKMFIGTLYPKKILNYIPIYTTDEFISMVDSEEKGLPFVLMNDLDFKNLDFPKVNSPKARLYGQGYKLKNITIQSDSRKIWIGHFQDIVVENLASEFYHAVEADSIVNCRFINCNMGAHLAFGPSYVGYCQFENVTNINKTYNFINGKIVAGNNISNCRFKNIKISGFNTMALLHLHTQSYANNIIYELSVDCTPSHTATAGIYAGHSYNLIENCVFVRGNIIGYSGNRSSAYRVGQNRGGITKNNYVAENVSFGNFVSNKDGLDGETISEETSKTQNFYEKLGYDFDGSSQEDGSPVWKMGEDGYPTIIKKFKKF